MQMKLQEMKEKKGKEVELLNKKKSKIQHLAFTSLMLYKGYNKELQ